jgi:NAD(P)-dependent dehydrogenase (short-subunit alcohol dehydrogenase family)
VSIASAFAVRGFTHVALISRDAQRLSQDEDSVLSAIQERGYTCQVKTWSCDLTDFQALRKVLGEVEAFGSLECVLFNAARVGGKPPLEEGTEEMERDFRVSYSFFWLAISHSPSLHFIFPSSSPFCFPS